MNKLEFTNKAIDNLNESIQEDGKVGLSKFIELTNKLYEAINYTHSCTELKDKEVIPFEDWLFVNNYKKLFDYFVKDSISFTESELMQIYNDKVMSL